MMDENLPSDWRPRPPPRRRLMKKPDPDPFLPVPEIDFEKLLSEGFNPKYFVKTSWGTTDSMNAIAELRKNNMMAFKKLDEDIIEFAGHPMNNQSHAMFQAKRKAHKMIFEALPFYEGATLHFSGSSINGCGLGGADVDLCWAIPFADEDGTKEYPMVKRTVNDLKFRPKKILKHAKSVLEQKLGIKYIEFVDARVSILKFHMTVDDEYLTIDININNLTGIYNSFLIAHYAKIDKRFPILARVFKTWGAAADIIDSVGGYLNSYAMVLMVIHYLQCGLTPPVLPNLIALRPDLFDGTLDLHKLENCYDFQLGIKMEEVNQIPIGDLLMGFIRYYAFFDFKKDAIIIRLGCLEDKKTEDVFLLEEVYDQVTVAKHVKPNTVREIKKVFIDAYALLVREPDFTKFMDSRHHKGFLLQNQFPTAAMVASEEVMNSE